jgi:hypothetical protein
MAAQRHSVRALAKARYIRNRPKGIAVFFWLCFILTLAELLDRLQSDQLVVIFGRPVGGSILKLFEISALTLFVIVLWGCINFAGELISFSCG